jgi:hypothetical protein
MVINMNETQLCTIEQIEQFLSASTSVEFSAAGDDLESPLRQNSCRLDMILNLGAIRMNDGTVRRSIQEQDGGADVAAGERQCRGIGERNWSVSADIGTMA